MNRIRYPDKRTINHQIDLILNKSGLNKQNNEQICVDFCKSKKYKYKSYIEAIAAAAVILVIGIGLKISDGMTVNKGIDFNPMMQLTNDDERSVDCYINDNILTRINNKKFSLSDKDNNLQDKFSLSYSVPHIYVDNVEVKEITAFYESDMNNNLHELQSTYSSGVKNNTISNIGVKDSFTVNCYKEVTKLNPNIVSFSETYLNVNEYLDRTITKKKLSGHAFDVSTGKQITIEDIFTQYDSGINELKAIINNEIDKKYDLQEITKQGDLLSADNILNNDSWYFSTEGIVVCVNNAIQTSNEYKDQKYITQSGIYIVIPYDNLSYIKSEYRI